MASTAPDRPFPVPLSAPICPTCGAPLTLEHDGSLDAWVCPHAHGMGFTLSEAYERIDGDEIKTIWQHARVADPGHRPCPICGITMVTVAVAPRAESDADLDLDVCLVDELFWFDAGELDDIPVVAPDAPPTAEETTRLAQITTEFGDELTEEWEARDNAPLRDHLIHRYGDRTANT